MHHAQWTAFQGYLYVAVNMLIAAAYFAFGPVLRHVILRGRREFITEQDLLTWFAAFVWWCGVHHAVMGPLMLSHGPLQWWILIVADSIVAWVSWTAVFKMLGKANDRR